MIKEYHKYKNAGILTLPVNADKSPNLPSGTFTWMEGVSGGYEDSFGIAIVAGKKSGGIECLDFDNHFGDAHKTLKEFLGIEEVRKVYSKHKLPLNRTQSGGYHLYYRCDNPEGNQKLASKPKWDPDRKVHKPDAIIETRGEGGFFVAVPTKGYASVRNDPYTVNRITKEEREILISAAKSFNQWVPEKPKRRMNDDERLGDIYDNDPNSIYEAKDALNAAGWTELSNGAWRRPGKDKGISATFGRVAENCFYCFTSNGHPFDNMAGYSPFRVVGLLKYDGDFRQFALDLKDRYNPDPIERTPTEKKQEQESEMEKILADAFIDVDSPPERPPHALEIRRYMNGDWQRLGTMGNFIAITGKAKSRKTFMTSILQSAAVSEQPIYNLIRNVLPENRPFVVRFDTEQGKFDAYRSSKLSKDMIRGEKAHFETFFLREYSPIKRCEIIEYALEKWKDTIGVVVIDGISDLAVANNDEEEATRVAGLLLKWTAKYNCHMIVVIHQTKRDGWATGHLGSAIMKKAEAVISVNKVEDNEDVSEVSCDLIRGVADFQPFRFNIDGDGFPVVLGHHGINTTREEMYSTKNF